MHPIHPCTQMPKNNACTREWPVSSFTLELTAMTSFCRKGGMQQYANVDARYCTGRTLKPRRALDRIACATHGCNSWTSSVATRLCLLSVAASNSKSCASCRYHLPALQHLLALPPLHIAIQDVSLTPMERAKKASKVFRGLPAEPEPEETPDWQANFMKVGRTLARSDSTYGSTVECLRGCTDNACPTRCRLLRCSKTRTCLRRSANITSRALACSEAWY